MSHTYKYEVPGYDNVYVIVNSDWSGPARLGWTQNGVSHEIEVPGEIVRKIASQEGQTILKYNVDRFLESLNGPSS